MHFFPSPTIRTFQIPPGIRFSFVFENHLKLQKMDEGSLNDSNLSNTRQSSIELPIRRREREREDETVLQDTMPAQRKVVMIETPTREPPVITPSSSSFSVNKPNQDPIRTEPQNLLEPKKRKLDRQIEERIPEIHLVGTITSAANIISDITEGAMCR